MSYDIHIEGIAEPDVVNSQFMTFGNYPKVVGVRGIHKLVARFLKCFMTPLGSDISDPDYGTSLMLSLVGNVDSRTLHSLAARAVTEAVDSIQRYDAEYNRDDDERLFDVEIQSINIDRDNPAVVFYLELKNVEGTTALVTVPMVEGS